MISMVKKKTKPKKRRIRKPNKYAKDLRTPKYKMRVKPDKKKVLLEDLLSRIDEVNSEVHKGVWYDEL